MRMCWITRAPVYRCVHTPKNVRDRTSVCAFSSEESDAECRATITIPFFARRKQVPQSHDQRKKKTDVQN